MDWVSMIFSFYPPFNERWWGLDPSEFRDMKEKERIIKEEMHAEESTWTFAIIWPKANNFGQKMMLNMFGLQHLWSPVLALNATNSWGEKKVVCNVKSSSHAFPCTFFPFHPFMCHCCVIVLFLTHSHCLSETKRRWRMRSTKGGRILSWRRWRHLEKCQKSWMQELRNSLVMLVVRGFFDAQNGEWIENGNFRNDELWRRNEDTDDIGWKKSARLPEIRKLQSVFQLRLTSDDRTGSSSCGTWGWNRDRESRHAQQRWLLCLHDLRPEWHTHLAVKFDRWEVWEGWILY